MPSPYYYYVYPFGQNADDLTSIPTNAAMDGSVSYYAGWTDPYEYNLLTNPAALPIPRGQMNQLFYDITNNLQEYQQYGTPQWVTGNTVSYPIYARVYYSGVVYESQVAANTATPGTDSTWAVISGNTEGIRTGFMIDFGGVTAPSGYLLCDGSAVSRTTYAGLLSVITQTQTGTLVNGTNAITGLSDTSQMYIGMKIEGTGLPSGVFISSITSSTAVTFSSTALGSATTPITFFNWGNGDGSTTFNVPDSRRRVSVGSGGSSTSVLGNVAGNTGGVETYTLAANDLPAHTHPAPGGAAFQLNGSGSTGSVAGTSNQQSTNTGNNVTSNNPISLIQPSYIATKIIKT